MGSLDGSKRRLGVSEGRRRAPSDGQRLLKALEKWAGMAKFQTSIILTRSKQVRVT